MLSRIGDQMVLYRNMHWDSEFSAMDLQSGVISLQRGS